VKILAYQKFRDSDIVALAADSAMLSKVQHPNLVQFYGICLESNNTCFLLEYMPKGNLAKILQDKSISLSYNRVVVIAREIASGMDYLAAHPDYSMNIHGNFNSSSVFITNKWSAKISDYGPLCQRDLACTMTTERDVAWTAPEVLRGAPFTPASLVYSFGVLLWEIYTREIPFDAENPLTVATKILQGYQPPIPVDCPILYYKLMKACWNATPELRPSWKTILCELAQIMDDPS